MEISWRALTFAGPSLGAWPFVQAGGAPATPPNAHALALSDMPLWAYGITTQPRLGDTARPQGWGRPFDPAIPHDEQLKPVLQVAGSTRTYARIELRDWANAADWFPDEHAPMPAVVQHGSAALGEKKRACAICHRVGGGGRPENAPVAGLPVEYFLCQLEDFRNGKRHSTDPRKPNVPTMIAIARWWPRVHRVPWPHRPPRRRPCPPASFATAPTCTASARRR